MPNGENGMEKGKIYIYTGDGQGKPPAALDRAIQAANEGKQVVIIQFLKGKSLGESAFLKRLEPEIKLFCFGKSVEEFELLSEERKADEIRSIRNGIGFARKILCTGECSLLVLDEALGLLERQIISAEDLRNLLESKSDGMDIILTGDVLNDETCGLADEIWKVEALKIKN